ncbi:MAG: peptidase S58 family protein [Alphaproteobacteria bacterium]|nr:peptidase S58 family protein [Alphaproteobacteria bacterium]
MTGLKPGRRNLITDVDGIKVGNAVDRRAWSGTTVVVPDERAVAAAEVRGGAPGTRDINALDPSCRIDAIDAIVLSGGSMFGIDAAAGVTNVLAALGRGYKINTAVVPIVPAAIFFDLINGGDKSWGEDPPYRRLGAEAARALGHDFPLGNVGAGLGAKAGRLKGGLGSASLVSPDGIQVGALVAVNAWGETVMPGTRHFWAWPYEQAGEFGGLGAPKLTGELDLEMPRPPLPPSPAANTTIAIVATNVTLDKGEARRMALMADDGLARSIRPVHTPFDGDTVFALSTGRMPLDDLVMLTLVGHMAADCLARAVARGVYHAETLGRFPGWKSLG